MMFSFWRWLIQEIRGFVEYLLIPSLAVILPWRWCVFVFHQLAKWSWLYHDYVPTMSEQAAQSGLVDDEKRWQQYCKVIRMIDAADVFLCLTRGRRYLTRYVQHNFDERLSKQAMIFFPHYGAGIWLYRYLAAKGVKSNLLVNPIEKKFSGYNILCRLRIWALAHRANTTVIYPSDMLTIRRALRAGETLLVAPDVPETAGVSAFKIETELGKLNVMSGFFKLAERRQLPVFSVVLGCDIRTGLREFDGAFLIATSATENATYFARQTVAAILHRSYLWHMWVARPQVLF